MKLHYRTNGTVLARTLRKSIPLAEVLLWNQLKGKKLGAQFYRQRPIGKYIVDFYCPRAKLVIELDGSQHYEEAAERYDRERDAFLAGSGLTVLRIPNNEVLKNMSGVIERIIDAIRKGII